jgi:hypothetical protein
MNLLEQVAHLSGKVEREIFDLAYETILDEDPPDVEYVNNKYEFYEHAGLIPAVVIAYCLDVLAGRREVPNASSILRD